MSRFQVGQLVVCLNGDTWSPDFTAASRPKTGRIYTIREVIPGCTTGTANHHVLLLEEIVNPVVMPFNIEPGFLEYRFAPVEPTSNEALTELLACLEPQAA